MKNIKAIFLASIFILSFVTIASAQETESIWLEAPTTAYKTGETVIVRVNAASSTLIQGFTFQIRYDPNCLEPLNASSPISGMNGLQLPQSAGLVDASFASTSPTTALGTLAEVSFRALGGCQTNLHLETAALAARDASGFAVPIQGVTVETGSLPISIDTAVGEAQDPVPLGEPLSLAPAEATQTKSPDWAAIIAISLLFSVVAAVLGTVIYLIYRQSRQPSR